MDTRLLVPAWFMFTFQRLRMAERHKWRLCGVTISLYDDYEKNLKSMLWFCDQAQVENCDDIHPLGRDDITIQGICDIWDISRNSANDMWLQKIRKILYENTHKTEIIHLFQNFVKWTKKHAQRNVCMSSYLHCASLPPSIFNTVQL